MKRILVLIPLLIGSIAFADLAADCAAGIGNADICAGYPTTGPTEEEVNSAADTAEAIDREIARISGGINHGFSSLSIVSTVGNPTDHGKIYLNRPGSSDDQADVYRDYIANDKQLIDNFNFDGTALSCSDSGPLVTAANFMRNAANSAIQELSLGFIDFEPQDLDVRDDYWDNRGADFYGACALHDACYSTIGKSRTTCDDEFFHHMNRSCNQITTSDSIDDCGDDAHMYYNAVNWFSDSAFSDGQFLASVYLTQVSKNISDIDKPWFEESMRRDNFLYRIKGNQHLAKYYLLRWAGTENDDDHGNVKKYTQVVKNGAGENVEVTYYTRLTEKERLGAYYNKIPTTDPSFASGINETYAFDVLQAIMGEEPSYVARQASFNAAQLAAQEAALKLAIAKEKFIKIQPAITLLILN